MAQKYTDHSFHKARASTYIKSLLLDNLKRKPSPNISESRKMSANNDAKASMTYWSEWSKFQTRKRSEQEKHYSYFNSMASYKIRKQTVMQQKSQNYKSQRGSKFITSSKLSITNLCIY